MFNGNQVWMRACKYHLLLARDLQLIPASDHDKLALETTEVKRMLTALIQRLTAES
jgi:four helix bundle protein